MFKSVLKTVVCLLAVGVVSVSTVCAQDKAAEYRQVVTGRAAKIVTPLGLADSSRAIKVRDIIAQQYIDLNTIHDARNAAVKQVKEANKDNKEKAEQEVKKLQEDADMKLSKLHKQYLSKLSKQLNAQQVEQVKNGMTYGVLPITYKGYQEMLPSLTAEQKKQILEYLTEAREHAMDAESSEKKHAWFGKYKGRINNYLSAAGIDMNKASKEWQARIKAAKENHANN